MGLPASGARGQSPANLYGLNRSELQTALEPYDAPRYQAGQIYRWLYGRGELRPEAWTDVPQALRQRLAKDFVVDAGAVDRRDHADDETIKFRVRYGDGSAVEAVYMLQSDRVTLCLSSQVGCALDCDFCLTGKMGFRRHLSPGEIVGQVAVIDAERGLRERPFNLVFMGMGEPLHNYDGVLGAYRLLTDPEGFGLSRRRITVSTSGLAPAIERLAREPSGPRLAVSLNATTDAVRDRIMPVNRKYPLARLLEACRFWSRETSARLTFEYVLLAGVNDTLEDADRLAEWVGKVPCRLNLIPFNPVPGQLDYARPAHDRILALRDRLLERRVPVSVRWSRGATARAACGQLAVTEDS